MGRASDKPVCGVYFVQIPSSGAVKIGFSRDVARRFEALQTASPEELVFLGAVRGGIGDEQKIHARFSATRVRGEWFSPSPDLLALAASEPTFSADVNASGPNKWEARLAAKAQEVATLPPPVTFGEHVRRWRESNGLTQVAAAKLVGVSQAALLDWESGKNCPRTPTVFRLCNVWKIDIREFVAIPGATTESRRAIALAERAAS